MTPQGDHRTLSPAFFESLKPDACWLVDSYWNGYKATHKEWNIAMCFGSDELGSLAGLELPLKSTSLNSLADIALERRVAAGQAHD